MLGHAAVFAIIFTMTVGHPPRSGVDLFPPVVAIIVFVLFYLWQTGDGHRAGESREFTRLFGRGRVSTERLRSAYEERIREAASQEERHRLARDLHDSIKQQIFAMQTAAATAQARFDGDPAGAKEALDRLRESGREATAEMEALLDSLRASPLENTGLVESLKKQCEALQFRTGAQVDFVLGTLPASETLAPAAQQAIFRVAQEAPANIGRHARARDVHVALTSQDGLVRLRIQDDGTGFDPTTAARGMGLANMRNRADGFDGRLDVLRQLARGRSNKEIAGALFVSEETVKTHMGKLLARLRAENRAQAIVQALKRGLVALEDLD